MTLGLSAGALVVGHGSVANPLTATWPVFIFTFCYALGYFVLTRSAYRGLTGAELRDRLLDANRGDRKDRMLTLAIGGTSSSIATQFALIALVCVLTVALNPASRSDPLLAFLAVVGVLGSWVLMTTAYASVYALAWARDDALTLPDLREEPSFGDFGHVAVQLSTAFSTSGAHIHTRRLRRTVTAHRVVGFCFSTVIVALLVALVAGAGA